MIRKCLLIISLPLLIVNCSEDEPKATGLNGEWQLERKDGGFLNVDQAFPRHAVTWTFDELGQQVDVRIHPAFDSLVSFENGSYRYRIEGEIPSFYLGEQNLGFFQLKDQQMTVDLRFVDGMRYSFVR